ncbi:hypothetical protein IW262DRAFT_1469294 [Armillaria fumosa]|nr:hypothetical protein IW262DRAFT_1469294 [Armillaria fumosa]
MRVGPNTESDPKTTFRTARSPSSSHLPYELDRLKRIEHEDTQQNLTQEQEDKERCLAFEEEKEWMKEQRERQNRATAREKAQRKWDHW